MSVEQVVLLLTGLGAGVIVPRLVDGIWKYMTGAQNREREAWHVADHEARLRREWEIYGHTCRRRGVEYGFAHLLPSMPPDQRHPESATSAGSVLEPPHKE